jgi:hypothetical protein
MSTSEQLVAGLGGAIGSHYHQPTNQLFFVEFNGKVSVLDLVRPLAGIVSQGTTVLKGTWIFDCETGALSGNLSGPGDIWWEQMTATQRQMAPVSGARIVNLGAVDFNALTHAELQSLVYGNAPIPGNTGAGNQLVDGDVFAVRTNAGNFAKVKVITYGYDMKIQWVTYHLGPRYRVLGTGYNQPEDIVVTSGGRYAYVTERSGNLLRVDLTNANRAAAGVVASGMTAPHQIALDEDRSQAYVIEFASPGPCRLWRVDLVSGTKTAVVTGLDTAIGLLLTADRNFVYVTQHTGGVDRIVRIELATGRRETLPPVLQNPFFLTWSDPGESAILVTERDPANRVTKIDLTRSPITASPVATGVPFRPSSVEVTAANRILVCSDQEIVQIDLTGSVYTSAGPMLMGIGHVPKTKISADGYATTDPGYFFHVKDAPFGGTLAVMINHDKARSLGAHYYRILVDGVVQSQGWSDYRWNTSLNTFELTAAPQSGSFFQVRQAGEVWYNYWLGYFLDTTDFADGPHTISLKVFTSANPATEIAAGADSLVVKVDNQWPRAVIDKILYHDPGNPNPALRHRIVDTCAIVEGTSDEFSFVIEAVDPAAQHLLSWGLGVAWGDNKSASIAGDSYDPGHVSPTHQWTGVTGEVPAAHWHATVAGDPTSRRCAHTFYLSVWDRVINGWGYIHQTSYTKSITLLLS